MTRRTGRVALGGALSLLVLSAPAWADLKIGFVNYQRLMQESPQGKVVQQALRTEFAAKQRELATEQEEIKSKQAALDRDGGTMSVDQRSSAEQSLRDGQRELTEKQSEYQDDMNARQNQELSKLQQMLVEAVQQYAQAQHFDLVLADGVIFANPTLDITQPVLASLQARGAAAPRSSTRSSTRSH
ncbi:MAG TPA: OmpH family outer membrane protein [Steroidobacteraceae bacterium]|jgi:outer membrane protein|nr:OmpH family outer membrane protein [Steroidobacteraceae bacterium]